MTDFFDSAEWPTPPPDTAYGCKYVDGEYVPEQSRVTFTHTRYITVHGHYRDAGIIDYEPGNWAYNPWTLTRFVRGRMALGKVARVYCDRADAHNALEVLAKNGLESYPVWWIATLDGHLWTADELAQDLAARWAAPIPAGKLWAVQWEQIAHGGIDQSALFGVW